MNYFHKFTCQKGTFFLVGTTEQAKNFVADYKAKNQDTGATLEDWYMAGTHQLSKYDLAGVDGVRIL